MTAFLQCYTQLVPSYALIDVPTILLERRLRQASLLAQKCCQNTALSMSDICKHRHRIFTHIHEPLREHQCWQLSEKLAKFTEFLVILMRTLPFWSDTRAEMT